MHCELPTQFGVHKVGDVRLGKRLIIDRARAKLRTLGHEQAAAAQAAAQAEAARKSEEERQQAVAAAQAR